MIAPDLALPLVIGLPLLAGTTLAAIAGRRSGTAAAWALAAVAAAALALVLADLPDVLAGNAPAASWPWVPALGLSVSLRLDGLALLFAGLILGIGLLVILYARYYLGPDDPPGKFYAQLALFMAAMLGVALADNLLLLAVFWELTSRRLVPADRLLAAPRRRAPGRAHGAGGDRRGGTRDAGGLPPARRDRRDLPDLGARERRRPGPRRCALSGRARAGAPGRVHEERAVPVPLLAARGDGGADAGVGVPALGDDGEGGRLPARPALPGPRRHAPVRVHGRHGGAGDVRVRRLRRGLQARSEGRCSPIPRSATSA